MEDARFFFMSHQLPRRRSPSRSIQTTLPVHENEAVFTGEDAVRVAAR